MSTELVFSHISPCLPIKILTFEIWIVLTNFTQCCTVNADNSDVNFKAYDTMNDANN